MNIKIFLFAILALFYTSCGYKQNSNSHEHAHDAETIHDEHDHENQDHSAMDEDEHDHDEAVKIKLIAYSNSFEVFAEADPFVKGKKSNILAHFTSMPKFHPLRNGSVTIRFIENNHKSSQTRENPVRPGIYSFEIVPEHEGVAEINFEISQDDSLYLVEIKDIKVYSDEHDAIHEAENAEVETLNTIVFTKEQSWKIDFATEAVRTGPFGEVIKTSALVQSTPGDELQISAKTNGMVQYTRNELLEGQRVTSGLSLFTISGSGLAEDNLGIRFTEAKNNFEQAKANYERAQELAGDKIVSQKALLETKNRFDNAQVVYENLRDNFSNSRQTVTSPMTGFVKQLFVQNGEYVVAGQPLITVSQNQNLMLRAEVQQKYLPVLGAIHFANIRNMHSKETYTLDELNGKIVSYGRTANQNNYMLPVNLQIDNKGSFVPGGFVELYLQTVTNAQAVTVPNSALLEEQGNFFVMVQLTPELFEKREVKTGASNGLHTEITSGLQGDERVVTKGAVLVKLAQSTSTLDAHSGHVH